MKPSLFNMQPIKPVQELKEFNFPKFEAPKPVTIEEPKSLIPKPPIITSIKEEEPPTLKPIQTIIE